MAEQQTIRHGLERISQWAKTYYQGDIEFIPGLSMTEIERIVKNFPFKVPEEIIEFYTTDRASIWAPDPYRFINFFNSIISRFSTYGVGKNDYLSRDDSSTIAEWCEINVAYGWGNELYRMRCYRHETSFSPVYIREAGADPYIYASSLTNSILATAECYESGAYYQLLQSYWDSEDGRGYIYFYLINVDWTKAEPIFKKYDIQQPDIWQDRYCCEWY